MAIVLVGMPASGKSTIGAQLAAELGWPFVDVDAMIEAESGRLIREIFADEGEARFRELEVDATLRALSRSAVVALGGGAVTSPVIRSALGGHEVVWLDVSVPVATRRAGCRNCARCCSATFANGCRSWPPNDSRSTRPSQLGA